LKNSVEGYNFFRRYKGKEWRYWVPRAGVQEGAGERQGEHICWKEKKKNMDNYN